MKRNAAAALAVLCLLSGCAQEAEPLPNSAQPADIIHQETVTVEKTALAQEAALELMRQFALEHRVTFSFTAANFPKTAVSASIAPLLRAAAADLLRDEAGAEALLPAVCPASADACRALLNGSADLILAEEPPAALWDEKDAAGFDWEMTPVAADALVFAVSVDNPINSLTLGELRGLYAGTITNWSELGGPDLPVVPLRGAPGSDTETAMENLVLDGISMAQAPALAREDALPDGAQTGVITCMGFYQADTALSGTDTPRKLIAVDGVEPSLASIRSGTYSLLNRCYVLIPAAAPQDSPARALRDWLVSREGQALTESAGYVSMMELGGVS